MTCDLAYVAGFFDGEGSVFLQSAGSLEVRISQVDRRPLDLIQARFEGVVTLLPPRERREPCHQWRVMRWSQGEVFLRAIRPWLIVKAAKADLVLTFIETAREAGHTFTKGHNFSSDLVVLREQLAVDLDALTTKGRRRKPGRSFGKQRKVVV